MEIIIVILLVIIASALVYGAKETQQDIDAITWMVFQLLKWLDQAQASAKRFIAIWNL